jgi:hypothetical protein
MRNLLWIPLVILVVVSFIPFREDLNVCRVYDSDYKKYLLWEEPMIYGLQVYSTESDAKLPFSIIGGSTNACYTHKWYQTLDGINLINKEIKSYSFIEKLLLIFKS